MPKKPKEVKPVKIDIDEYFSVFSRLTYKQKEVFLYLCDPSNINKRIEDITKELSVSEKTVRGMTKDARDFAQKICLAKMLSDIPAIADKFIEKAKEGSYNHGKLIFEMTGLHTPKQETKNENVNQDVTNLTPEQRKERIKELRGMLEL